MMDVQESSLVHKLSRQFKNFLNPIKISQRLGPKTDVKSNPYLSYYYLICFLMVEPSSKNIGFSHIHKTAEFFIII